MGELLEKIGVGHQKQPDKLEYYTLIVIMTQPYPKSQLWTAKASFGSSNNQDTGVQSLLCNVKSYV